MNQPVKIDPEALYDDGTLCLALGLRTSAVEKARKAGTLRHTRRGGRTMYLSRWVHDWLIAEPADAQAVPA